jgi:RHS repeat-associated protein
MTLTNAGFTATLSNMTIANTSIGGTCTSTTTSPSLNTGDATLNLTVPSLPTTGCTVTLQVTSSTQGSNPVATSGVTVTENATQGPAASMAYLTVNPADVGFSYVHADHLGTPRAITDPATNNKVWEWRNDDAFGRNQPNENPNGQGTFTFNLRFPGQYADVESGTFYNYFRDYDPTIGRYEQSDPIGLKGALILMRM